MVIFIHYHVVAKIILLIMIDDNDDIKTVQFNAASNV